MKFNKEKVVEFLKDNTSLWHDSLIEEKEEDDYLSFKEGNTSLSFKVNDNKVNIVLNNPVDYDEERYTISLEFIYNEQDVDYNYSIDKYYYDDVPPTRGKDVRLRHQERSFSKKYSLNEIMPIDELYTPSKIK